MKHLLHSCLLLLSAGFLTGQSSLKIEGPVIQGYGSTWEIKDSDLEIDDDEVFNLVFDLYAQSENPARLNSSLNTLARFLNMHVHAGVDTSRINLVAVVHGKASFDVMKETVFTKKYGFENPNAELIQLLSKYGVDFYICGQSMNSIGLTKEQILPEVKVALSAMTAIAHFVSRDFVLISF